MSEAGQIWVKVNVGRVRCQDGDCSKYGLVDKRSPGLCFLDRTLYPRVLPHMRSLRRTRTPAAAPFVDITAKAWLTSLVAMEASTSLFAAGWQKLSYELHLKIFGYLLQYDRAITSNGFVAIAWRNTIVTSLNESPYKSCAMEAFFNVNTIQLDLPMSPQKVMAWPPESHHNHIRCLSINMCLRPHHWNFLASLEMGLLRFHGVRRLEIVIQDGRQEHIRRNEPIFLKVEKLVVTYVRTITYQETSIGWIDRSGLERAIFRKLQISERSGQQCQQLMRKWYTDQEGEFVAHAEDWNVIGVGYVLVGGHRFVTRTQWDD
ncbi:hypothetical protein CC80DRAFT_510932 [Byssothecium circinans]|uniref:Uncharacterized protein n=1 Tax=Byssothecium circinans TaxID=147558 RepID=A0A6A5T8M5_9PLEO|nr:hypothetical protein CC80DRAFT_510932 [Byssothecium circinans]